MKPKDIFWTSRAGSIVPTPLLHEGHLYWADMQGIAYCVKASNGAEVYRKRLGSKSGCYASPVLAGGNIYYTTRLGGVYVIRANPKYEVVSHNTIKSDSTRFDGTPAIADQCIYLRSNSMLYCVQKK